MVLHTLKNFPLMAGIVLLCASQCDAAQYDIDVRLNSTQTYQVLSYRVAYSATGGTFDGSGTAVSCTVNATLNATAAFNDIDSISRLSVSLISTGTFTGPVVLATCTLTAPSAPTAGAFTITTVDYDTAVPPSFSISRIQLR